MNEVYGMLLNAVKIDTGDLNNDMGKTEDVDRIAVSHMEGAIGPSLTASTNAIYASVKSSKFCPTFWSNLTMSEMLSVDYKAFAGGRVGVGSALIHLDDVKVKDDIDGGIKVEVSGREVLVIMCMTVKDGKAVRGIMVLEEEDGEGKGEKVKNGLEKESILELVKIDEYEKWGCKVTCYEQGNGKASRKIVGPIIDEIYK